MFSHLGYAVRCLVELQGAPGRGDGLKKRRSFRQVLADCVSQRSCRPEKHPRVPVVFPATTNSSARFWLGPSMNRRTCGAGHPWSKSPVSIYPHQVSARNRLDAEHDDVLAERRPQQFPFCSAFGKRGSAIPAITWSEGNTPSTASGFSRSIRNAARPPGRGRVAGYRLLRICAAGRPGG